VEAAYDTNDMMLIFKKKSSVELPFSSFGEYFEKSEFNINTCHRYR
jgi:hypothetical protein